MFFKKAKKTRSEKYKAKRDFFDKIYISTDRQSLCFILGLVFAVFGLVGFGAIVAMTLSPWALFGLLLIFAGFGGGWALGIGIDELNRKLSKVYGNKLELAKRVEKMLNIDSNVIEEANSKIEDQEKLISNSKDTIKYTKRKTKKDIKENLKLIKELSKIKSANSKSKIKELEQTISQLEEKSKTVIEDETKSIEISEGLLSKAIQRKNEMVANLPVRTDNMIESQKSSEDTKSIDEYSDSANNENNSSNSNNEDTFDDCIY